MLHPTLIKADVFFFSYRISGHVYRSFKIANVTVLYAIQECT